MVTFWGIAIIVTFIIEVITVDLVSIWLTIGSAAALIAALLNVPTTYQIIICIVVTLLSLMIIRPLGKKYLRGNIVKTNYDRIIGKSAVVTEDIGENTKGRVMINSDDWLASSLDHVFIEKGKTVEIVYIEGAHVVVKEV